MIVDEKLRTEMAAYLHDSWSEREAPYLPLYNAMSEELKDKWRKEADKILAIVMGAQERQSKELEERMKQIAPSFPYFTVRELPYVLEAIPPEITVRGILSRCAYTMMGAPGLRCLLPEGHEGAHEYD